MNCFLRFPKRFCEKCKTSGFHDILRIYYLLIVTRNSVNPNLQQNIRKTAQDGKFSICRAAPSQSKNTPKEALHAIEGCPLQIAFSRCVATCSTALAACFLASATSEV